MNIQNSVQVVYKNYNQLHQVQMEIHKLKQSRKLTKFIFKNQFYLQVYGAESCVTEFVTYVGLIDNW